MSLDLFFLSERKLLKMDVAYFVPIREDHRYDPINFVCEKTFVMEQGKAVFIIGASESLTKSLRNRINQTTRSYDKNHLLALMSYEGPIKSVEIPTRLPLNMLLRLPQLKIKMMTDTTMKHILFMTCDETTYVLNIFSSDNTTKQLK